jgi:hypothetical protein
LAEFCLTKSLSCNVAVIIRDALFFRVFNSISEKLFQVFKEDFVQIPTQKSRIPCFHLDGPIMRPSAHQCREALNSSRLHPSGHHGNTSGLSSEFEKIPALLSKHGLGRQLPPVQTPRQHRPDTEILDKEIACIHYASVQMTGQYRLDMVLVMIITCIQNVTVRTLGQHRPDVALIWKHVKHIMESWLHRRPFEHSMLRSRRRLEKSETDSI